MTDLGLMGIKASSGGFTARRWGIPIFNFQFLFQATGVTYKIVLSAIASYGIVPHSTDWVVVCSSRSDKRVENGERWESRGGQGYGCGVGKGGSLGG